MKHRDLNILISIAIVILLVLLSRKRIRECFTSGSDKFMVAKDNGEIVLVSERDIKNAVDKNISDAKNDGIDGSKEISDNANPVQESSPSPPAASPPAPTETGCYLLLPTGCPLKNDNEGRNTKEWFRDQAGDAGFYDQNGNKYCQDRKAYVNSHCGTTDARMSWKRHNVKEYAISLKKPESGKWCADYRNQIKCEAGAKGSFEKWTIRDLEDGTYAFRGGQGGWCGRDNTDNKFKCNRNNIGRDEKFKVEDKGHGKIAIKSNNGKYCTAWWSDNIECDENSPNPDWGQFQYEGQFRP